MMNLLLADAGRKGTASLVELVERLGNLIDTGIEEEIAIEARPSSLAGTSHFHR
jgi:hypothetical protein